mgnify:CR=1 FL=1
MTNQPETGIKRTIDDLTLAIKANNPLILIRTDEPNIIIENLYKNVLMVSSPPKMYKWNTVDGLDILEASRTPTGEPTLVTRKPNPEAKSFLDALKAMATGNNNKQEIGIFTWPQWSLVKGQKEILHTLFVYSYKLWESKSSIIFLAPHSYEIPEEIERHVTVLTYDGPSVDDFKLLLAKDPVENKLFVSARANDKMAEKLPNLDEESIANIANALAGLNHNEAINSISRVLHKMEKHLPDNLNMPAFVSELSKVKADVLRKTDNLEIMQSYSADCIGGLDLLKAWIKKRKDCFSNEAKEFGVKRPRGVMLVGSPGTGKSLSAKAIAHELNSPLIKFNVSKSYSKYVGESEGKVESALRTLSKIGKAVVYIDEIDKLFSTSQGDGDSGVGKRVLSAVLNFMQESEAPIFWVFTANRINNLPPELVRPGRIDDKFILTMPTPPEALDITNIHLINRKQKPIENKELLPFANYCYRNFLSAAEIENIVNEAVIDSYTKREPMSVELLTAHAVACKPMILMNPEDYKMMITWGSLNAKPSSSPYEGSEKQADLESLPTSGNWGIM